MKPFIIILMLLFASGCAAGPTTLKRFISPSKAAYDQADAYFQKKDYPKAIAAYEKFIKDYPQSNLLPGAYLGLAWSRYLTGDCQETIIALGKARLQDPKLKAWAENLQQECKKRIAKSPEAATIPMLFNIPPFTNQERLKIEGTQPSDSKVLINDTEAQIINGLFFLTVSLKEGENLISISITDKDGKTETTQAKVSLDKTKPQIKVTSAELDDFGYLQIEGVTKKGAQITAEGEPLDVDDNGNFSGRTRSPRNKQIKLAAKDQAGNTATETFYDSDYPYKPSGLRLRSLSGTNAEIEWNSNKEKDLKGYNVYYSLAGEFSDRKNNREVVAYTTYTVTDLRSGRTYQVYIRAQDKMGNESEPSTETLTIPIP